MIKSKKHLFFILKIKEKEIQYLIDNIDKYYRPFKKPKLLESGIVKRDSLGNELFREICPSIEPLKKIQNRIKIGIFRHINFPNYIQGGVKNKDNVKNARLHLGKKYHFITDLKNFFPSIKPKLVYDSLVKLGFSADVSSIITKLTTFNNQVPQGAPTSTYIANIIFFEADENLNRFCKQNEITYSRFIDDLVFSSQKNFKPLTHEIISIIKKSKFKINNNKTKYKIGPVNITGVFTKNNILDLTDSFRKKLLNSEGKEESVIKGYKNYCNKIRSKI